MSLIGVALLFALMTVDASLVYLYLLAAAAVRVKPLRMTDRRRSRFAVVIAAHDEEAVIGRSVATHLRQNYPRDLVDVHVVADHCSDATAARAQAAGAIVHERADGAGGSKSAALRWLFPRVLGYGDKRYDAVVVFDADTLVDAEFLNVMDARLGEGDSVIQGQHRIVNPQDGWFPALTWAMFIIDNRLQNLGRSNLGWSAKNMGDSICFRADVLRRFGWGEGLTEDYQFRQQLLLEGVHIRYEPRAVGFGEAALNWRVARAQRTRWLRGTHDASRRYADRLLVAAVRRRDLPLLDGALQARLPSYSSLSLLAVVGSLLQAAVDLTASRSLSGRFWTWFVTAFALCVYPLLGLILERAPMRAYLVILTGPVFIVWRTWLSIHARYRSGSVVWVRTPRRASH